jgi:hypothetical protein
MQVSDVFSRRIQPKTDPETLKLSSAEVDKSSPSEANKSSPAQVGKSGPPDTSSAADKEVWGLQQNLVHS